MADLKKYIRRRGPIRSRVTISYNGKENYKNLDQLQIRVELKKLLEYKEDLKAFDTLIFDELIDDGRTEDELEKETESCMDYIDKISTCLAYLDSLKKPDTGSGDIEAARSLLRQPTAPLPTYSGKENEDLTKFLSEFELTTSCYKYPDRDRLLLLIQQLSGNAKTLLGSLEVDKQSYKDAKDLLISAFVSDKKQKRSTISRIMELQLGYKDDPYDFISKVKVVCETVKTLKISADDFLQFFIWNGINKKFQTYLTQITSETLPSVEQIVDNYFVALERYNNSQIAANSNKLDTQTPKPSFKGAIATKSQNSSGFAVGVSESKKFQSSCNLCEGSHSFHKCTKYCGAKDKVDRLKSLGGCTRCGKINHPWTNCRMNFSRPCSNCGKWHFSSLCVTNNGPVKSKKSNTFVESNTRVVSLPYYQCGSILPTFTFNLLGKMYRGLQDRASEGSFITDRIAKHLNLKVVHDNIKLTVNGFNGPQNYTSKVVEVPVDFEGKSSMVMALVIPEIQMKVNLPKMGHIIITFKNKKYKLADKMLGQQSSKIDQIDFVLGADYGRLIQGNDVPFGKHSLYIDTSIGILLLGNLDKLKRDLNSLPTQGNTVVTNVTSVSENIKQECTYSVDIHTFFVNKQISGSFDDMSTLEYVNLKNDQNLSVLDSHGHLNHNKLQNATEQILENQCKQYLNEDCDLYNDESLELNQDLVEYTLKNIIRGSDGRIQVPLLWNGKVAKFLARNLNLSKMILNSNLKRWQRSDSRKLKLTDQTVKEQLESGIIERVDNLDRYLSENPGYSFMPHMSIFKWDKETTKCRIVFLSNLSEQKGHKYLSHNQTMYSGPNLNQKLSAALLHLRFGKYLLTYDIKKAFNQLSLNEIDQSRLLFFWFKNVEKQDFSLVAYRNVRLSFGLRCSPFLLMIAFYYILVLDAKNDPSELRQLKNLMYSLLYMDNGAIVFDESHELSWAYDRLHEIFSPYCFDVQQLNTNEPQLGIKLKTDLEENSTETIKLLGLQWNKTSDLLFTRKIELDSTSNTKRKILRTIASQFDIAGFNLPILNRSRLFMHDLQCRPDIGWDDILPQDMQRNWRNICLQANACPPVEVPRFIGPRNQSYKLLVFTDASHVLYGNVVYLLHIESNKLSFVCSKNRMVNTKLKRKSIPSLELNALVLGVETLLDVCQDLAGPTCLNPINIVEMEAYTDSLCCIHWIKSSTLKLDKMSKISVFVKNRLQTLQALCDRSSVTFKFISGEINPADAVTRCLSYKQLGKTNFLKGPDLQLIYGNGPFSNEFTVTVPNPAWADTVMEAYSSNFSCTVHEQYPCLLDPANFSSFLGLVGLYRKVLRCAERWKNKTIRKFQSKDSVDKGNTNLYNKILKFMLRADQLYWFPEVITYFLGSNFALKDIPDIVSKLNIFMDQDGILRVKSKFKVWKYNSTNSFPILLHHKSNLTNIIISDLHEQLAHAGCYSVLAEFRKHFFVQKHFSTIKKSLMNCFHCKRFNARTIKLNQSDYRDFRSNPPQIPYASIFIDYMGPFYVKRNNSKEKVWLLCLTCLWTRAVNLKVCYSLDVDEFLRALQLHCFEFGVPRLIMSDLGSQLVSGFNILKGHLNDVDVSKYLDFNGIKSIEFTQYFKGCHPLGSLVEVCVKLVKRLIFGCIKNNVLDIREFEFVIAYVIHLINRRPIAFKEGMRTMDCPPEPITPEHLIRGYELVSINLIPGLVDQPDDVDWDFSIDPSTLVRDNYYKLRKIMCNLKEIYSKEFVQHLVSQAVGRKDRYRPVTHKSLHVGDVVLIKEEFTKPNHFPLAIVEKIVVNDIGEVTGAIVKKGTSQESVKRHASVLVPLLQNKISSVDTSTEPEPVIVNNDSEEVLKRPIRKAAQDSREKSRRMLQEL